MCHARTQRLRAATVLGVLALAACPARADHLTYSLADALAGQTASAAATAFADLSALRPASDGKAVDPAHVYFSLRLTPGPNRRGRLKFDALANAPSHLAGGFPGRVHPHGDPAGLILARQRLGPPLVSVTGHAPGAQRDFPGPVDLAYAAGERFVNAPDEEGVRRGLIRQSSQAPEPPTLTLLALGAVGLLGAYWRQRRLEPSW